MPVAHAQCKPCSRPTVSGLLWQQLIILRPWREVFWESQKTHRGNSLWKEWIKCGMHQANAYTDVKANCLRASVMQLCLVYIRTQTDTGPSGCGASAKDTRLSSIGANGLMSHDVGLLMQRT